MTGRTDRGAGESPGSPTEPLHPGRVRVPGSTSNLGAGFDCLGLAVDRELTASFEPGGGDLVLRRSGTLEDVTAPQGEDLLLGAFRRALAAAGCLGVGGVIEARSTIPIGKGLGSSAAAVVAGTALAHRVRRRPVDPDAAFRAALEREGHGDNAAPCAYGGLRAVVGSGLERRVLSLELSPEIAFAYAAPPGTVSTRAAREALPASVPFALAVDGVWRTAALLRGLATGDGELLALGFDDALHAPHRMALVPGAAAAVDAARDAGAWGVTVSGAGSGLLAVGPSGRASALAVALAEGLARRHPVEGIVSFPLRPVEQGARAVSAPEE